MLTAETPAVLVIVCSLSSNETANDGCEPARQEEERQLTFIMSPAEFQREEQNTMQPGQEMGRMSNLLIECNERPPSQAAKLSGKHSKLPKYLSWLQAFPELVHDKAARNSLFNALADRWLKEKKWLMLKTEGLERLETSSQSSSGDSQTGDDEP